MIDNTTHNKILEYLDKKIIYQSKIKNILITGCGGFIGGYLVSALLSKKFKGYFKIYGYDIISPKLDKKSVFIKNFFFKKVDLTKKRSFFLNKKIDLIIHLAGIPSPKYYKKFPLKTFYLNSDLCKILLDFSKKKKAKFIYFSSSEIYGSPDKKNIPTPEITMEKSRAYQTDLVMTKVKDLAKLIRIFIKIFIRWIQKSLDRSTFMAMEC